MDGPDHQCPECERALTTTLAAPSSPDLWVRVRRSGRWSFTPDAPVDEERATVLAYRCGFCSKTFRMAFAVPARSSIASLDDRGQA